MTSPDSAPNEARGRASHDHSSHGGRENYVRLLLMSGLSFVAMYGLMYAMVDVLPNVYHNVNQVYMAGLMVPPMVVLELLLMRSMYRDRTMNVLALGLSAVLLVACWVGIREQVGVSDRQFIRSMIPHHAGAILMCEQATLDDPRLRELCTEIVASQREEIRQLKALLADSDR